MTSFEPGQEVTFHPIPGVGEPVTGTVQQLEPGDPRYLKEHVAVLVGDVLYSQPPWTLTMTEDQHATVSMLRQDAENRFMGGDPGALRHSTAHNPSDPAFALLLDGKTSTPVVHLESCYICRDPEFAAMGLPLCRPCPQCKRNQEDCGACSGTGAYPDKTPCTDCLATGKIGGLGHIAADDNVCDDCGYEDGPDDYPELKPEPLVPPFIAKTTATTTPPAEPYSEADMVAIPDQEWRQGEESVITVPAACTVQGVQIWDSSDPARPVYWVPISKRLNAGDSIHVPGTIDVTLS